jgi:hypothetical protein
VPLPASSGLDERVETLIGEGLFEFGDVDGRYPEARLQHPLGVTYHDGIVYIADAYNHKIKRYNIEDGTLVTFLGTGEPGATDGPPGTATFNEPGGLAAAGGRLFVADTNNHQIRVADLETGIVSTLPVAEFLGGPRPRASEILPRQSVAPGEGFVRVEVLLPEGYTANALHPGGLRVTARDEAVARPAAAEARPPGAAFPFTFMEGETVLHFEGTLYYCEAEGGRCLLHPVDTHLPLMVGPAHAGQHLDMTLEVALPKLT